MSTAFPKLPGFYPTQELDRTNFKKISAKKLEANHDVKNTAVPQYVLPRQRSENLSDLQNMGNPDFLSTTHDTYRPKLTGEINELYQPNWVRLDRHVLRFFGFFKESVVESPQENYRVRKVIVYYYLEDNSISVIEPKQTNSGIPQGPFLKRQKVLRGDNSGVFLAPEDFVIGGDTLVFGKNIRIYDCDEYTREFFELAGRPQPGPECCPNDNFEQKTLTKFVPQKDHMMKDFMEHKLGGGRIPSQKQFLANDRKVLKFYVFSDIRYIIHYYLADDTLEIREINHQNSGRDPFPLMLRRQKLPRKFSLNQPGQVYMDDFIKPEHFVYGETLEIFGKKFKINGCDKFTQEYFKTNFNRGFPLGSIEESMSKEQTNIVIPPYNGFGDEEDSLGYVYKLMPLPPKKNYFKWVDNQIYLRFSAKFNTKKPEDVDRKFIITYFLNDDTLAVYEPAQRNSGISEGKFLEKKKYKNPNKNNEFFLPADLIVGKDVVINSYSFHIYDCDEYTKKWFAENFHLV